MGDPAIQRDPREVRDVLGNIENDGNAELWVRTVRAQGVGFYAGDALLHLPFDGGVPYETDYSVNLYGHKLQRPTTVTGGIIGRPGKFGKAVQLAEATTNLCPNPVMRTLWTANSGPTTLELSTDWKRFDQYSMHVVGSAAWSGGRTLVAVTAGSTYTLSCYVKIVSGTAGIRIQQLASPYATYFLQSVAGPYEGWVTVTGVVPNTETCMIVLGVNGEAYFDGVQLEAKAYPTPFCYGDMGPGHAWTGTAHASTSTRTATDLRYAPVLGEIGTVSAWVLHNPGVIPTKDSGYLWRGSSGSGHILSEVLPDGRVRAFWGSNTYGSAAGAYVPGTPHMVTATSDGATLCVYLDGILVASGVKGNDANAADFCVGSYAGSRFINGYLDDLLILDRALTAPEVRALYAAGQAGLGVLCPPQSWQPLVGAGAPTWGFPGMTYIDTTNNRWYVNVGGTWRYAGLT